MMPAQNRLRHRTRQRGLTMVELIMFIVIVGVAVVGVLGVISLNTRSSADPILRKQAMAIAESLVDEIRAARFSWCDISDDENYLSATSSAQCATPEAVGREASDGARPFHNVNDYVQAYGTPVAYATDAAGNPFPAGYAATVAITPAALGPAAGAVPATESLRILVTVTYGQDSVTLETYRTRYAPNN
jgi:MSHA pilin protein MshD